MCLIFLSCTKEIRGMMDPVIYGHILDILVRYSHSNNVRIN